MNQEIEIGEKSLSLQEVGGEVKETFTVGETEFVVIKGNSGQLYLGNKVTNIVTAGPNERFKGILEEGCEDCIKAVVTTNHETSQVLKLNSGKIRNYGLIVLGDQIWYLYENGTRERMQSVQGYRIKSY